MRDRLVKLQCLAYDTFDGGKTSFEHTADVLLENGVVALPCKVGDMVYSYNSEFGVILPYFVENLTIAYLEENESCYTYEANCSNENEFIDSIDFDCEDIGKTVFLTKEEAERALKSSKSICDYTKTDWNDCCDCSAKDYCDKYNERSEIIGELLGEVIGEIKNEGR